MLQQILFTITLLPSFAKSIRDILKYSTLKDEWYMCWHVMGPRLYYRYLTGTAVEKVDFF